MSARGYVVTGEWLAVDVGEHTCGTGRDGHYGAHEPGCGLEPVAKIADLLAADSRAADLEATVARVEALRDEWQADLDGSGGTVIRDENARHCWDLAARELSRALVGDATTRDEESR